MPYIVLALGVILGLYGLYRFFLSASVPQIRALTMTAILVTLCGALILLAVTGRLPAALALLFALSPLAFQWWKNRINHDRESDKSTDEDKDEQA